MNATYTQRRMEEATVTSIDPVKHSAWFNNPPPGDLAPRLAVGDRLDIESRGSTITGWRHNGVWHSRKSDEDLKREHEEFVADKRRRDEERLEQNREAWERRTAALPEWLQSRIRHFIDRGGRKFALEGWGYELVICEMAALFTAPDFDDNDEILRFCSDQGVSGNQHGMARALARAHHEGQDLAGTVSALSPITGDPDYSGSAVGS